MDSVDAEYPRLSVHSYPSLPTPRTYAVLGTGAVGGFYGARLQQAGCEVHFLLHGDYEHVRQKGLIIESIDGDFQLPSVKAYPFVEQMPACDVVLVALKTTQNYLLSQLLPAVVKPGGVVLVLQNGLGVEADVAALVGSDRVIGGLCYLCSNKIGPGHIRHVDYKEIMLAEYAADYAPVGITERMQQIASDFQQAGIPVELSPDLFVARWKKLVWNIPYNGLSVVLKAALLIWKPREKNWNIPYNGLSVVLDANTDQMMADVDIRSLVREIMQEVADGCAACVQASGVAADDRLIPQSFIEMMLDHTEKMKPYRTSMKLDYDERRLLEVEAIFGNPLRMAEQAGKALPHVDMLYRQLQLLDRQRRSVE